MKIEEGTLAQFIITNLPHISPDLEIGQAINAMKWIRTCSEIRVESCPVGGLRCPDYDLCRRFRKYNAQLRFKQPRYEIAIALRDYLQVWII